MLSIRYLTSVLFALSTSVRLGPNIEGSIPIPIIPYIFIISCIRRLSSESVTIDEILSFLSFSTFSQILIIFGIFAQIFLAAVFILLLKKEKVLHGICDKFLCLMAKLHIVRKLDKKRAKLTRWIASYKECAAAISGKRSMLIKALIFNVLQRASLISVTLFSFLAAGGEVSQIANVWVMQSMVVLGSNCVPIPGAMGVADYLMLDAFSIIMTAQAAVNLELLARSVSFYFCVALSGLSMIIRLVIDKIVSKRKSKINGAQ